jgi:hypothetical protein
MDFGDLPYGPLRAALKTILGRGILMVGVVALAAVLGSWTAGMPFLQGLAGFVLMPVYLLTSFLFAYGLVVAPLLLVFGIAFVRSEWNWRWLMVPLLLAWWNFHEVIDWSINRSPTAKMEKKIDEAMAQVRKDAAERAKKKREQEP